MKMTGFTNNRDYGNWLVFEQSSVEYTKLVSTKKRILHLWDYTGRLLKNDGDENFLDINWVVGPDWLLQWPQ